MAEKYQEPLLTNDDMWQQAVFRMGMGLGDAKLMRNMYEIRERILDAVNGVIEPIGGAGPPAEKGHLCLVRFNGPHRFCIETAWDTDFETGVPPKTMGPELQVSMSRPMERMLSHYADAVAFWGNMARPMRIAHPYFMLTGGGASAEKIRDILTRLCRQNPILAFSGTLFCMREHGSSAFSLVPPEVSTLLVDGTQGPPCIFSTEDKFIVAQAVADLVKLELDEIREEVDDVISSGTRKDGHSAPTGAWVRHLTALMKRFANEGAGWTPVPQFGAELRELAQDTSSRIVAFQLKGFSPPPKTPTKAAPSGVQRVMGVVPSLSKPAPRASPKARRTVNFAL
jgi:hypothetical protein